MTSINQRVWKLLSDDVSLQNNLVLGIVNIRALAKYLIKKHQLKASLDSVISAIRRYDIEKVYPDEVLNVFKDSSLKTRTNIICLTLKKETIKYLLELITKLKIQNFQIVTGVDQLKLFLTDQDYQSIKPKLQQKHIIHSERDLCEIILRTSPKSKYVKGVLAKITNELSLAGVNIIDIVVCPPDNLIYVKQEDIVKSHKVLLELTI
jgi:hypothetical protein